MGIPEGDISWMTKAILLFAGGRLTGRFTMPIEEAKSSFLTKAAKLGLIILPEMVITTAKSYYVDFTKVNDRVQWRTLAKFADWWDADYEEDGDPPWRYLLIEEDWGEYAEGTYTSLRNNG